MAGTEDDALLEALQRRLKADGVVARKVGNNLLAAAVALARDSMLSMAQACDSVQPPVPIGDARTRVKKYHNHIVGGNLLENCMDAPAPADARHPKPRGPVPKADGIECAWDDVDGCWRKGEAHPAKGDVHIIDHEARRRAEAQAVQEQRQAECARLDDAATQLLHQAGLALCEADLSDLPRDSEAVVLELAEPTLLCVGHQDWHKIGYGNITGGLRISKEDQAHAWEALSALGCWRWDGSILVERSDAYWERVDELLDSCNYALTFPQFVYHLRRMLKQKVNGILGPMYTDARAAAEERFAACEAEGRDFNGTLSWGTRTVLRFEHMEIRANVDDVIARYRSGCSMTQAELEKERNAVTKARCAAAASKHDERQRRKRRRLENGPNYVYVSLSTNPRLTSRNRPVSVCLEWGVYG